MAVPSEVELPTVLGAAERIEDPREWLEDVLGDEALAWVRQCNAKSVAALFGNEDPRQSRLYGRFLDILESKAKIPYIGRVLNGLLYNFWQDDRQVRGVWRRCTIDEYRKPAPAWETVLDIDALNAAEGEPWVWKGSTVLDEGPDVPTQLVLISLSRGGADATVVREFDICSKAFVPPSEGGFFIPEAKSRKCWKDRNTLLVGSDFGSGSMTESGYPRTCRQWSRGTPLDTAPQVFDGLPTDVSVSQFSYLDRGRRYEFRHRSLTFYESEKSVSVDGGPFLTLPVPNDADVSTFGDRLLVTLRSAWGADGVTHPAGSLLSMPLDAFVSGQQAPVTLLFLPTATASMEGFSCTRSFLILAVLDNVRSELVLWRADNKIPSGWVYERTFQGEGVVSLSARGVDEQHSDQIWVISTGYLTPTTLGYGAAKSPCACETLKSLPAMFNAAGLQVEQRFATSADGTRVPYFMVERVGALRDGSTPTLLYAYGGFEISLSPGYAATVGAGWLEYGNCYVQANIRGGGEYGPSWHQAALKEKRHKAFEDFEAVAADLIATGVTSPSRLGIQGGSNGGMLVGNAMVREPSLFGAVVCEVPLLDMRRYNKLLAGASWMGEYGNPDLPQEWEYLKRYSPYHRLAYGVAYPRTLFTTSTRDDRVHPAHARKMVHKMEQMGQRPLYFENIEGGHDGAADHKQRAFKLALAYTFLLRTLGPAPIHLRGRPPIARVFASVVLIVGVLGAFSVARARAGAR